MRVATLRDVYAHDYAAAAYDLIHQDRGKDYRREAEQLGVIIRRRLPEAVRLLDVACGSGLHLASLSELGFEVAGVERSPSMLEVARRRVPDVALHEGDMRSFDLGERFDAVVCLFSAIGYMTTDEGRIVVSGLSKRFGQIVAVDELSRPVSLFR